MALDEDDLARTRLALHAACQWPSMAARANLAAVADDSHSNLGWSEGHRALVSRSLTVAGAGGGEAAVAVAFAGPSIEWYLDGRVVDELSLNVTSDAEIKVWLDGCLTAHGLLPTGNAVMPYQLDVPLAAGELGLTESVAAIAEWFGQGHAALTGLIREHLISLMAPEPRVWPHHFDLGILFALEEGDPETVRSVGVGFSPGDDSSGDPYLYCSPWPVPDAALLPEAGAPLRWHTEGFVSVVRNRTDVTDSDLARCWTAR